MNTISLFLAFIPWIGFALIAQAPLGNPGLALILAFVVGIVLTIATSYHQLMKKYILSVVTMIFFIVFFIIIIVLQQYYLANYLSVLSMLSLAIVCWGTILFHFPFTLQYSREGVEPERAKSPLFLRANYIITAVWASAFTLGFAIDELLVLHPPTQGTLFWNNMTWVFMVIAIVFTIWYPAHIHKEKAFQAISKYYVYFKKSR